MRNIFKMRHIISGSEEGLKIMDEMLAKKKEDYYKKYGVELTITNEEFYDMVRKELSSEMRELGTLLSVMTIFLAAKISNPDDDKDKLAKNRYSYLVKLLHKISDEVAFYYNPLSFESITTGSVVPSLNLLVQAQKAISHTASLVYGEYKGDEGIS